MRYRRQGKGKKETHRKPKYILACLMWKMALVMPHAYRYVRFSYNRIYTFSMCVFVCVFVFVCIVVTRINRWNGYPDRGTRNFHFAWATVCKVVHSVKHRFHFRCVLRSVKISSQSNFKQQSAHRNFLLACFRVSECVRIYVYKSLSRDARFGIKKKKIRRKKGTTDSRLE